MIRLAQKFDLPVIAAIEQAVQKGAWTEAQLVESFEHGAKAYVFEVDGQVVGYILSFCILNEMTVLKIAVLTEYQRQGIGKALLKATLADAIGSGIQKIFLEVRISNEKAIRLYEKMGFERYSVRKDYYTSPDREDGAMMVFDAQADACLR